MVYNPTRTKWMMHGQLDWLHYVYEWDGYKHTHIEIVDAKVTNYKRIRHWTLEKQDHWNMFDRLNYEESW